MADAGRRAYAGVGPRMDEAGRFEGEFAVQKDPPYIADRLQKFDKLHSKYRSQLASKPKKSIRIELHDGSVKEGKAFETTPMDIILASPDSKALAETYVVAKLIYKEPVESLQQCVAADNEDEDLDEPSASSVLWDLTRPLEGNCRIELLKFDHPQGQDVFWHSSAHILGQAMERQFGCHLTIGPALARGFYYDGYFGDFKLKAEDLAALEREAALIRYEEQAYERCVISKEEAVDLFSDNPFKVQLITRKVPDGAMTSCYRCGLLVDLCRGPHLPNTSMARAFKITKNSAAYWLSDQQGDSLQRVYGISFPSVREMDEHIKFEEEAAKRDHRNIGKQQELLMWHPSASPGSAFWFPYGARIYNKLIELMRSEYRLRGFSEVITPNIYSASVYKASGHYQNYRENMFGFSVEKNEWFMKPMNCPGHFLMFDSRIRSHRELPLRFADFGVLHRNEESGALSGLIRVRRFQQDDAHIFVRPDQIREEVVRCLDFLSYIYGLFGFKASYALSTRPKKKYLGSKAIWDNAEAQLRAALDDFAASTGNEWSLKPGDGAFYGPKIDIELTDAMKRKHQCGTIQLDFNNPIRFNLQYRKEGVDEAQDDGAGDDKFEGEVERDQDGEVIWREGRLKSGCERPVVIHRAILGSVERFSAVIMEHYAGKWPFWLSPRQVMVVPVGEKYNDYAQWVKRQLVLFGFHVEVDLSSNMLQKKVRSAQLGQWNYVAVVGQHEADALAVNLRQRDVDTPLGLLPMAQLIAKLDAEAMPVSQPLRQFEPFDGRLPQDAHAVPQERVDTLEEALARLPYVSGFKPSAADAELFASLQQSGVPETPNKLRWYEHISSFSAMQRAAWR